MEKKKFGKSIYWLEKAAGEILDDHEIWSCLGYCYTVVENCTVLGK